MNLEDIQNVEVKNQDGMIFYIVSMVSGLTCSVPDEPLNKDLQIVIQWLELNT